MRRDAWRRPERPPTNCLRGPRSRSFQCRFPGARGGTRRGFRKQSRGRAAADAGDFGARSDPRRGRRVRQRWTRVARESRHAGACILRHPRARAERESLPSPVGTLTKEHRVREPFAEGANCCGRPCFTPRAIRFEIERARIPPGWRPADSRRAHGGLRRYCKPSRRASGRPSADLRGGFLLPGFIDTHIHFPQLRVLGGLGRALLDWLEHCALPEEARMADHAYACDWPASSCMPWLRMAPPPRWYSARISRRRPRLCLKRRRPPGCASSAGRCSPTGGCFPELHQTPEARVSREQLDLIRRFHGTGDCLYAVTPRFALSTSEAMLEVCQTLLRENSGRAVSNASQRKRHEIAEVARLFPWASDYLAVYERFGLGRQRRGDGAQCSSHRFRTGAPGGQRRADCALPVQQRGARQRNVSSCGGT